MAPRCRAVLWRGELSAGVRVSVTRVPLGRTADGTASCRASIVPNDEAPVGGPSSACVGRTAVVPTEGLVILRRQPKDLHCPDRRTEPSFGMTAIPRLRAFGAPLV